jgi:hypothetical protein
VRALEEKLPGVERQVKRHLPHGELPSKAVGQGTLLDRVAALEHAMDTLLRAQVRRACQRHACCGWVKTGGRLADTVHA